MAGKGHRSSNKEYDLLDKLKHENKILKTEIKRLRKELDKNKVNYENVTDLLEQQTAEELAAFTIPIDQIAKRWQCYKCHTGTLKILIINKADEVHYFRKCSNCANKTKLKKYTKDVEGVKDDK